MSSNPKPVFFDPNGRRARATNVILASITLILLLGLTVLGLSLFAAPSLPKLSPPPAESRNVTDPPDRSASGWPELQISPARSRQIPEQALRAKRLAFF